MTTALIFQIVSCLFMTGVIWLVQILVYPTFAHVSDAFGKYHDFHTRRITWVVAPMMLLELISGACLFWLSPHGFYFWNLIMIILIWCLTGLVSVPIHNRIQFEPLRMGQWLTRTNWARTVLWTSRSIGWILILKNSFAGVSV